MAAAKVLELMDWVPNLAKITALRISTQDKCNPNTCKQIVKKLVAAKKKAKEPMITKLVLHGPKIYGSLIPELKKSGIGKTLTSLTFHQVKTTQQSKLEGAIDDLFRSLPFLEELYIPQGVVDSSLKAKVFAPLQAARGGGKTLLRVLDLWDNSSWTRRVRLSDVLMIGKSAPELEVLSFLKLECPNENWSFSGGFVHPALVLGSPMTPLPRLKKFAVNRLVDSWVHGHSPQCEYSMFCLRATLIFAIIILTNTVSSRCKHGGSESPFELAFCRYAQSRKFLLRPWQVLIVEKRAKDLFITSVTRCWRKRDVASHIERSYALIL